MRTDSPGATTRRRSAFALLQPEGAASADDSVRKRCTTFDFNSMYHGKSRGSRPRQSFEPCTAPVTPPYVHHMKSVSISSHGKPQGCSGVVRVRNERARRIGLQVKLYRLTIDNRLCPQRDFRSNDRKVSQTFGLSGVWGALTVNSTKVGAKNTRWLLLMMSGRFDLETTRLSILNNEAMDSPQKELTALPTFGSILFIGTDCYTTSKPVEAQFLLR
jgi:hypothetical protein